MHTCILPTQIREWRTEIESIVQMCTIGYCDAYYLQEYTS